jgi:hypothetical protein
MKALFLSNEKPASRSQIQPFYNYRRELEDIYDFRFDEHILNHLGSFELNELDRYDVVFVQTRFFRQNHPLLVTLLRGIRGQRVVLDDEASSSRCIFQAAPLADLYVKKQVLRNFDDYRYQYPNDRIHAFYVDVAEGRHTRRPLEIPDDFRLKLYSGWNIGTTWNFEELVGEAAAGSRVEHRPLDISMRLSVDIENPTHWFYRHRQRALESLEALSDSFHVLASKQIVPSTQYHSELRSSKMCLSPWGYGEICYRDFEAIMAGALLIKPPMDYIATNPDIYRPGETYVQVRADFSDLREVCAYYLDHEAERLRITRTAHDAYNAYFTERTFLRQMGEILSRLANGGSRNSDRAA